MLPTEFELLLKVVARPDDDEPRLVYADVLQERGDDRGEFIPLQCSLARWSSRADPSRFGAMRAREGALLSEHGPTWLAQAVPFECVGFFHRGFVEELQCLPGELLERGLEVVAPIRVLRLDGETTAEVARWVMALPLGARVEELTLRLSDSAEDRSLKPTGAALRVLRQLSAEANTVELLSQLGWLPGLERLELPLTERGAGLVEDLAIFKPARLEQLWLRGQGNHRLGRDVVEAIARVWAALPSLAIRWRGVDYRASDEEALKGALEPFRVHLGQLVIRSVPDSGVVVEEANPQAAPDRRGFDPVLSDPRDDAPSAPMELIPLPRPPAAVFEEPYLEPEGLRSRGYLPRALPQSVTLLRAEEQGASVLVAIGKARGAGVVAFAEDVARLMSLAPGLDLLRVTRTRATDEVRWALFEGFEGVSLWELLQLHPRLPPSVVLRVLGQTAAAAAKVEGWLPSADDVLLDVRGQVRLLPGFPRSVRTEESSYSVGQERHPLGMPPEDTAAPGALVVQLGTALFELLSGTTLFDLTGRSSLVLAAERYQLVRQVDRGGLSLAKVDPALAVFEPLLARALSHAHSERFDGLESLAVALENHPLAGSGQEVARLVRAAVIEVPRSRDGR